MRRIFYSLAFFAATLSIDIDPLKAEQTKLLDVVTLADDLVIRDAQELGPETGFPMPRYVSLKFNLVNLRTGPGLRYPIEWVFQRKRLPMIVVEEFEHWRQVRTHDGVLGWVHKNQLTGTRTFRVKEDAVALKRQPDGEGSDLAFLQPGVVGKLNRCELSWCRVTIDPEDAGPINGWLSKEKLFGVGPSETFKR